MGSLNESPKFVAVIMKLKNKWNTLAKEHGLKMLYKIIVGDVLLYGSTSDQLLDYFRTVLDVLKHPRATINLKSENGFRTGVSF